MNFIYHTSTEHSHFRAEMGELREGSAEAERMHGDDVAEALRRRAVRERPDPELSEGDRVGGRAARQGQRRVPKPVRRHRALLPDGGAPNLCVTSEELRAVSDRLF